MEALFLKKNCKQPKCPLVSKCVYKIWLIHTTEYDSAIKRNKLFFNPVDWLLILHSVAI